MTQIFLICAVVGGILLAFQLVMSLLGLGGHDDVGGGHDVHLDHGHDAADHGEASSHGGVSWLMGFLTFRNLVAGLTFFGLVGLATTSARWHPVASFAAASGAGVAAMAGVGLAMRGMMRLQADGTVEIDRTVGLTGTVYVTVPGNKTGAGKIHVDVQNRTAEYEAVTFQDLLPTGSKIVVVDVIGPDTVEVIAAPQYGRMTTHV